MIDAPVERHVAAHPGTLVGHRRSGEGISVDLAATIAGWPVDSASVAVIGGDGVLDASDDGRAHHWASVTKILTAMTVLDGVAEGVVALDDPVGPPGSTLRHLLCHASGLALDSDKLHARPGPAASTRTAASISPLRTWKAARGSRSRPSSGTGWSTCWR
ncbi:MAG TPA: serine hydrolase [Nakamurella sp.]